MRYAAPEHVTGISLSVGPFTVVDGFIEVPDDLGQGDLGGLAMNGFKPAPADLEDPVSATVPAAASTTAQTKAQKADQAPAGSSPDTKAADGAATT